MRRALIRVARWLYLVFILFPVIGLLVVCSKPRPPTPPTPSPTPAPAVMPPLETRGNRFFAGGQDIDLLGTVVCCENYPANGWPFASVEDLDLMKQNGLDYTHFRAGPFVTGHERPEFIAFQTDPGTGLLDLTKYRPEFWALLDQRLTAAEIRGVYVEVSVGPDCWTVKHEVSALSPGRNVQGVELRVDGFHGEPPAVMKAWATKVLEETARHPNVIYELSNEQFQCGATDQWIDGYYRHFKAELRRLGVQRLVGSDDWREPGFFDYFTSHSAWLPQNRTRPTIVNEYGQEQAQIDVLDPVLISAMGLEVGVYFQAWRGSADEGTYRAWLAALGDVRRGRYRCQPDAEGFCTWPDAPGHECQRVSRFDLKVLNEPRPGVYVIDSTAKPPLGGEGSLIEARCNIDQVDPRPGQTTEGSAWGPNWSFAGGGDVSWNRNRYLMGLKPGSSPMTATACSWKRPGSCGSITVAR